LLILIASYFLKLLKLIICMFTTFQIRSSADAEIVRHASRWMPPKSKTLSQDTAAMMWVGFGMLVAEIHTYPVLCTM